jgi:hypothetical protein
MITTGTTMMSAGERITVLSNAHKSSVTANVNTGSLRTIAAIPNNAGLISSTSKVTGNLATVRNSSRTNTMMMTA